MENIGYPSKMPGTSYGLPAAACVTGSKLAQVEGSVCSHCYAMKGHYAYPNVAKAQAARLKAIESPAWVQSMAATLNALHSGKIKPRLRSGKTFLHGHHRWHDSGDIQSVEHLEKIIQVCQLTPDIKHWLPTREGGFLKALLRKGTTIPRNLIIRLSATMIDGPAPRWWKHTSTVLTAGASCPARHQGGVCGDCRRCWDGRVKNVSYPRH